MRCIEESGLTANSQATSANLVELACSRANEKPDRTAYVFLQDGENESGRLTFAELNRRARVIAARLQRMGMAGKRALLLYPPGLDYIEGFFGCLYAGVVAVPASLPTRRQKPRLLAVINDAAPAVMMTTTDIAAKIRDELASGSDAYVATKVSSRDVGVAPTIPNPVWLATDRPEAESTERWIKPELSLESLAFLQYTSGSTGDPKGVMVSHGNLMANQAAIKQGFGHTENTTVVGWLPLYHDMGLIGNLLQPLYLGATAVLMPPMAFLEKPVRWLKAISNYRANTSGGPNFAYDLCCRKVAAEQMQALDLSAWTLAFNGSEPVRAVTLERFAEKFAGCGFRRESFFPCYGLAEATLYVSGEKLPSAGYAKCPEEKPQVRRVSCGATSDHHEIRIVDPETGSPCQDVCIGEVWVAGPSIAQGYWNRQEASEQTFRARLAEKPGMDRSMIDSNAQSFLRTGDLGYLDNGRLYITGRIKDLIIIRGRNFYPQDIEQALTGEIPALVPDSCVAFSINRESEEQLIVAAEITRAAMRSGDYEVITAAMRKLLAEVCELAAAELVLVQAGAVPKTSSGKIRRQPCKQMYLENSLPVLFRSGDAPVECAPVGEQGGLKALEENSPEYQLLQQALWAVPQAQRAPLITRFLKHRMARLLKVEESLVATDSPLRSLGLDSLKAVELKHAADDLLGTNAPLSLFLSDDSLEKIAEKLSGISEAAVEHVIHAHVSDSIEQSERCAFYNSNLSATQFSMWTMQHLEPNSIVYNLHLALCIAGALERERLRQAFRCLAERHPMLRTVYRTDGNGGVIQQVMPVAELPDFFTAVDASAWPEPQLQSDMARRAAEPFDLTTGSLLRIACYVHGKPGLQNDPFCSPECSDGQSLPIETCYTLLICAHHIAVDLWSVLILVSELKTIYAELSAGAEVQLNALPSDYTDFVAWQSDYLKSPASEKAWAYWQRQLTGELPLLALPTDRPRPAAPDYRGASLAFGLRRDETEQLKKLAGQRGVTLFALLLTAYKVLLHRYTHQKDVIVGVPSSGRSQSRFAPIVGNFVNPLPLRSYPSGNKTFTDYLAEVNAALLSALEHQDFPFSLTVERLQPERIAEHWPIYQTLFVLQQAQAGVDADLAQLALGEDGEFSVWGNMQAKPLAIQQRVENFDLKLMAAESKDGLLFSFQYRCDLFTAEMVADWAAQFRRLLMGVAFTPDGCLSELPMLSPERLHQLTKAWNKTEKGYIGADTLHGLLEEQVLRTPDAVALVSEELTLSYLELNQRANRLAHVLIGQGVRPGTAVGICSERSADMVIGLLAVLKAGGAYLPLDPDYPKERLTAMLEDAQASLILAQSRFITHLPAHFRAGIITLQPDCLPVTGVAGDNPGISVGGAALAYVLFTSGSTGRPKGVGIPHAGVRNRLLWMQERFGLDGGDAVLQKTPYTFDVSVWEFFWPLLAGARLVMLEPGAHKEPERLTAAIRQHGITTIHFVPSMLSAFLEADSLHLCRSLRRVICSGEALTAELQQRFFAQSGAELHNLYGPTEASIDVTAWSCRRDRNPQTVPIGRPIANTRIYLLDDHLNPVPANVAGELYIAGVQLARGYLNRPDLTAERFLPDPFDKAGGRLYKTGDLARYREDGNIDYLGRSDHQVKLRGFRIELGEIEAKLSEHAAVRQAAVIVREDHPGSKRLVAYLVTTPDATADEVYWNEFLEGSLPDYMIPAAYVKMEQLPLSANGKLDKKALPVPFIGERFFDRYVAPRTPAEKILAGIWAQLLQVERVGIHDNFFGLAGDSILAIQVVSRARKAGLRLTPRQLFQYQTVAELAEAAVPMSDLRNESEAIPGRGVLSPIQHWFFELDLTNPHYWNQALILRPRIGLDPDLMAEAVRQVWNHHDALGYRFRREADGWIQNGTSDMIVEVFQRMDLSNVPEAGMAERFEQERRHWQASLHIGSGPLSRVVWFDLGEGGIRILIVIHHLVVDGVSWRILLDDLQTVYRQLVRGEAAVLPPRTSSFDQWSGRLQALAGSEAEDTEITYWQDIVVARVPPVPVEFPEGSVLEGKAASVRVELNAEDTDFLLHEAAVPYRTDVNDLLLTALALALNAWNHAQAVRIDVEGHGRVDLFENMDLSRSIGWFTAVYPLLLDLPPDAGPREAILAVKTQRQQVPRQGIGFGMHRYLADAGLGCEGAISAVLFNYLGRFDRLFGSDALFDTEIEPIEACRDSGSPRAYELEINAGVQQGCLVFEWRYGLERYRESTVQAVAERCMAILQDLLKHCRVPEAGGLTPGDFPLANLSEAELNALPYPASLIEDVYPLSPMQEGMLFDTLLAPGSGIYLMQDRFELQGFVDAAVFKQAWQQVLDRQPVLRTAFHWETASSPRQIVLRRVELPFDYLDWREIPPARQEALLEQLLREERELGFDFAKPPLMAIRLLRLTEDRYCFIRSYHHILVDAWCMSLILVELKQNYERLMRGQPGCQAAAPSFRDYLAWLQQQDEAATERFWRNYLRGFDEPTPIAIGKAAQAEADKNSTVGDAMMLMTASETRDLNALAQRYRLTPNTLIQAAWALLLSRYSGNSEVLFGVTVAGRPVDLPGSDTMLGVFINSLPLRVRLRPEQALRDFLDGLLEQNLEIRQFEHASLLQIQAWSDLPRGTALFESLLVFENYPIDPSLRSGEGLLNIVDVKTRTHTNYPLNGMVIPGERLHLQITYHTDRYGRAAVERMLGHFYNLLTAIVRKPEQRLGELTLLSERERQRMLVHWNRSDYAFPQPCDVVARFERQVERTPEAVAVACQGEWLSYRELNVKVNTLAHALRTRGIESDSLVALLSDRGIGFATMMLAVFKAGAAYLPLDPGHPDARLQQVLSEGRVAWLLADSPYLERARALFTGAVDGTAHGDTVAAPSMTLVVLSLQELSDLYKHTQHNPPRRHMPGQLAFTIFTSGSTGTPKGAMVEHRGMFNNLITKVSVLGLSEADIIAQTAGPCFDISVWQHLTALVCGARVEIVPDDIVRDPNRLLQQLAESRVTVLEAVPSMIQALLELAGTTELPDLRWLIACGEAFPPELCRRWMQHFPKVRVLNAYGPAECSDDVTYHEITEILGDSDTLVPIGRPVANTRLYLLDPWLEPVPVGVPGELCVAGIQVGRGYLHRPGLTADKFIPDPFGADGGRLYRTGDLGRYREGGTLEFLGRTDHQVKIRGVRVEPGEIEAQLLASPLVAQALVTVQGDGIHGKRLAAYVVCKERCALSDAELTGQLREYLGGSLPSAMVPSVFIQLKAMPLGANGKIDRKALPAPNLDEQSGRTYLPPRNEAEVILAGIWREVLAVERAGVEDNFFDLGGHSLTAVQVMSRIRSAFGVDIPLRRVFEAPTIAQLALAVEECLIEQIDALSEEEAQALLEEEP